MEEAAFLRLLAAAPADDAPRLIYADWLDDRGDPRGLLIRTQCALARLPADDPRRVDLEAVEAQLLDAHAAAWARPLVGRARGWGFRRGFVEELTLSADDLLAGAADLAYPGHLRTLHLSDVGSDLDRVLSVPVLRQVRTLGLYGNRIGDTGAAALAQSPHLAQLEALDLSENGLTDLGVRALLARPWPNLRTLDLRGGAAITGRSAAFLARARGLPALATLDLSDNRIDGPGVGALAQSRSLRALADLRVIGNPCGDVAARLLAGSPLLARSTTLDLSRTQTTSVGVRALVADRHLRAIRVLKLAGNRIDSDGLVALAASDLPNLRELDLSENLIDDEGAFALAASPVLKGLLRLNLENNLLTTAGVGAVGHSPLRNWRMVLELSGNDYLPPPLPDRSAPLPLAGE